MNIFLGDMDNSLGDKDNGLGDMDNALVDLDDGVFDIEKGVFEVYISTIVLSLCHPELVEGPSHCSRPIGRHLDSRFQPANRSIRKVLRQTQDDKSEGTLKKGVFEMANRVYEIDNRVFEMDDGVGFFKITDVVVGIAVLGGAANVGMLTAPPSVVR